MHALRFFSSFLIEFSYPWISHVYSSWHLYLNLNVATHLPRILCSIHSLYFQLLMIEIVVALVPLCNETVLNTCWCCSSETAYNSLSQGGKICLFQCSHESPVIFTLLHYVLSLTTSLPDLKAASKGPFAGE